MKIKALAISLTAVMVTGCTGLFTKPQTPVAIETLQRLTGIWAMIPLNGGAASVIEFGADAKLTTHQFNCVETEKHSIPKTSDFKVSDDGKSIHIKSSISGENLEIEILTLQPRIMELGMGGDNKDWTFKYLRVNKVESLCAYYPDATGERTRRDAKRTPFKASDFIQNPKIPAHSNMQQYIGKWANNKGVVQIEIVMDSSGSAYLYNAPNENWNYLYNNVHWVGNELHFQSYAYSDRQSLYSHPYHKSQHQNILQLDPDGKLHESSFIGENRYESVLSRKDSQD